MADVKWIKIVTDIFDVHDYEQDVEKFTSYYAETSKGIIKDQIYRRFPDRQTYQGEPLFISEYGGIRMADEKERLPHNRHYVVENYEWFFERKDFQ